MALRCYFKIQNHSQGNKTIVFDIRASFKFKNTKVVEKGQRL